MATLRELKGRIGSVASTEKITGAMKMISSAKMRKAEMALRRLVPFRESIRGIIANLLASDAEFTSHLTEAREVRRLAVVAFGSDDGLCGAYNANLFKFVQSHVAGLRASVGEGLQVEIYAVGSKMLKATARLGAESGIEVLQPEGVDSKTDGDSVKDMLERLMQRFLNGEIDRVDLAYMRYHSAGRQRPVAEQLLPVDSEALAGENAAQSSRPYIGCRKHIRHNAPYAPAGNPAGRICREPRLRAGRAGDGHAGGKRQCSQTSRTVAARIQ